MAEPTGPTTTAIVEAGGHDPGSSEPVLAPSAPPPILEAALAAPGGSSDGNAGEQQLEDAAGLPDDESFLDPAASDGLFDDIEADIAAAKAKADPTAVPGDSSSEGSDLESDGSDDKPLAALTDQGRKRAATSDATGGKESRKHQKANANDRNRPKQHIIPGM